MSEINGNTGVVISYKIQNSYKAERIYRFFARQSQNQTGAKLSVLEKFYVHCAHSLRNKIDKYVRNERQTKIVIMHERFPVLIEAKEIFTKRT